MPRRRYLICYDVADDKRRNRIFCTLRDHGNHAQYSVFFCELNRRELADLRGQLRGVVHTKEDQVLILDLGHADNPLETGLECLGKPYNPSSRVIVV